YNITVEERRELLAKLYTLSEDDVKSLYSNEPLSIETADKMIENVVGTFPLPLGLALNFLINGKEYIIPMAVEEPSIIASVHYIAETARECCACTTEATDRLMSGQIQVVGCPDFGAAKASLLREKEQLVAVENAAFPSIVARGGGDEDLDERILIVDADSK